MSNTMTRPFLKWLGGKYRLIPAIKNHLPTGEVLVEPFVGGGAVFLNTEFEFAHLNDINPDLINLYRHLQNDATEIIPYIASFFTSKFNKKATFYRLREKFNHSTCTLERSALFVYLNRHGFNGLCRYNSSGLFNVPFGYYEKPYFPEQELHLFAAKAQRAVFSCESFVTFLGRAPAGSVVYCDPPYVPLSATASFTSYASNGFGWEEQQALVEVAKELAANDVSVLVSNHDTPATRKLYRGASLTSIKAPRVVSAKAASRRPVAELLALYE